MLFITFTLVILLSYPNDKLLRMYLSEQYLIIAYFSRWQWSWVPADGPTDCSLVPLFASCVLALGWTVVWSENSGRMRGWYYLVVVEQWQVFDWEIETLESLQNCGQHMKIVTLKPWKDRLKLGGRIYFSAVIIRQAPLARVRPYLQSLLSPQ